MTTYTVFCPRCKVCVSLNATRAGMQELTGNMYSCTACGPVRCPEPNENVVFGIQLEAVANNSPLIAALQRTLHF